MDGQYDKIGGEWPFLQKDVATPIECWNKLMLTAGEDKNKFLSIFFLFFFIFITYLGWEKKICIILYRKPGLVK